MSKTECGAIQPGYPAGFAFTCTRKALHKGHHIAKDVDDFTVAEWTQNGRSITDLHDEWRGQFDLDETDPDDLVTMFRNLGFEVHVLG